MKILRSPHLTLIFAALWFLSGCGSSVYQPSRVAGFELEPQQEIDDEDIGKAFAAKPQVPAKPSVSYYAFDDDYAEGVSEMLTTLPAVDSTYRIPALMVSGKRRFDRTDAHGYAPYGHTPPTQPISMKKLRLLAARAHSDLLVVVDYGYRVSDSANGLVALSFAIVPIFFVPMRDVTVESYVDSYVIDTRNGYLYGHVQTTQERTEEYVALWSDVSKSMIDDQFDELMGKTGRLMAKLLQEERGKSVSPLKKDTPDKEPAGEASDAISARQKSELGQSR